MNKPNETQPAVPPSPLAMAKRISTPATGAMVGTSVIVLMVELARSGALQQYKEVLAPLLGWGPGLLILVGFLWLAHTYAPPLIESQHSTATALQRLADAVEHTDCSNHDLVLAMQVNSDKLEQLRTTVAELHANIQQLKEDWRDGRK